MAIMRSARQLAAIWVKRMVPYARPFVGRASEYTVKAGRYAGQYVRRVPGAEKYGSKVVRGYKKVEEFARPRLRSSRRLGKLAFRGELLATGVAGAASVYHSKELAKDVHNLRRQNQEREQALQEFKQKLALQQRKRVRRTK